MSGIVWASECVAVHQCAVENWADGYSPTQPRWLGDSWLYQLTAFFMVQFVCRRCCGSEHCSWWGKLPEALIPPGAFDTFALFVSWRFRG